MLIDTHVHLDDEQFDTDRPGVIERAVGAGVKTMIAVGITADSSESVVRLAQQHSPVWAAVGIQPNYCAQAKAGDWDRIKAMCDHPAVKAIGETGLDRFWDYTPFEVQQDYFDRHLRLSQERDLPFIVHLRDCGEDIVQMLEEARRRGPLRGVMHSFTGDTTLAMRCQQLGLFISFAGMVTYKKSTELRQTAAAIDEDLILIETDAPYLSPHPKRGQRPNEPALIVHTARCLAEARGVTFDEFAERSSANARRLFRLEAA